MEKREGLRAGISSIRQDYRSGGLVSKEGPRQKFQYGGYGNIPLTGFPGSLTGFTGYNYNIPAQPQTPPPVEPERPSVKSRSEFYTDYEKENSRPAGGGGMGGAKARAAYQTKQSEAYDSYLENIGKDVGFTPEKSLKQFAEEYQKDNPKPTGRVYYKTREAWERDFANAKAEYESQYLKDLDAVVKQKNEGIRASNQLVKSGGILGGIPKVIAAANELKNSSGETTMVSNEKIDERRKQLEQQAAGRGTQMPKPDFMTVEETVGQDAMEEAQLQTGTGNITQQIEADKFTTAAPRTEQVSEVAAPDQVVAPTVAPTQTMTPATTTAAGITEATGAVSDAAQVGDVNIERITPIEGVDVTPVAGAITERVVAKMSPEAVAQAAEISGVDVRRVTRAKEELRTAGIDALTIAQLGNDPKALEAKLMDLTDEQRGLVQGLPQDALVSNQMDALLKGVEEGSIPTWAKPAVAAVDQILVSRGLEASTVGRDALLNVIIQNALPIAQQNAQAIQASIAQERGIEAQIAVEQAKLNQQTALQNAQNVFQLDLAQFSGDQQTALANSKFLQTVSIANATNDQQAVIQNAAILSQTNLAQASIDQQRQINNAKAFLQMDLANLTNTQQANVLRSQQEQQVLLNNQAAENAAQQFNATSENQRNQFMATLAADIEKFNTNQMNLIKQFNVTQTNTAEARNVQREVDISKFNTTTQNQIEQFNTAIESNRLEFNAKNEMAIAQSNAQWRRQINTADTAAANAATEIAAKQAFDLTAQAQANLWQDMRDQAGYLYDRTLQDQNLAAKLTAEFLAGQYTDNKALSNSFRVMSDMVNELTSFSVTYRDLS